MKIKASINKYRNIKFKNFYKVNNPPQKQKGKVAIGCRLIDN